MERVTRPYITVGVVLAATSLVVATPAVTPSLPNVEVPDIALSADVGSRISDTIGDEPLGSHQAPIDDLVSTPNTDFSEVYNDLGSLGALTDNEESATTALQQILGDGALLGLVPPGLLDLGTVPGVDAPPASFQPDVGASQFGGAGGAAAQEAAVSSEVAAYLSGISAAASQLAAALTSQLEIFNEHLLAAETTFNTALIAYELQMEQAAFGSDGALNGVLNHGFDSFNMVFAAQEQALNALLGAGSVPVLGSTFGQSLSPILAEISGLQFSDFNNLFANFDGALFSTALQGFFTTLVGGPFGDVVANGLTPIFTDATDFLDSIVGIAP